MKLNMATSYLATMLILMMLSAATAQEKLSFPDRSNRNNLSHYGMSSHGHDHGHGHRHKGSKRHGHDPKGHKRGGHHHHHSKKHHPPRPKPMDFDDVEELLRIHQIKSALQEEKISRSANKASSWRSSSSSSSSEGSSSSSLDDSAQGSVKLVVDEKSQ